MKKCLIMLALLSAIWCLYRLWSVSEFERNGQYLSADIIDVHGTGGGRVSPGWVASVRYRFNDKSYVIRDLTALDLGSFPQVYATEPPRDKTVCVIVMADAPQNAIACRDIASQYRKWCVALAASLVSAFFILLLSVYAAAGSRQPDEDEES